MLAILLTLLLMQGGIYEGEYQNVFFADATVNVKVLNSTFDNCTGKVVALGKEMSIFSRFKGEINAIDAEVFIKDSEADVYCKNSTITMLKSIVNVTLKNCTLKASLNEIRSISIEDDMNESSRIENLPLVFTYKNKSSWFFVGNYWPDHLLRSKPRDKDGDGVSDSDVCPKMYSARYGETSFCEAVLVDRIENYSWHAIERPPLSVYRATENGLEYVGPYEETSSTSLEPAKLLPAIIGAIIAIPLIVYLWRKK